ncbi:MAG TPA: zinc ribbon domain-containing protein [Candidatus Saccharimonadales bacterium]|nr:zinc ribbon domain-containing protein [Candidatus Saccharimonadales bacterium]
MNSFRTPETCPTCGADVPKGAKACPECGADERTGWSEEAYASGLGLPDDSFDYDDFVKREFNPGQSPMPRGIHWFWWVVAIAIVIVFAAGYFFKSSK